ncbi:MAG: TonB C-terminal domain-containing protein [Alphaproteobacteria bacterium]|nr:TonB C-terminal domain-containing protein [Alphaproteobacteria bacterium]MDY4689824.1 hypothetical protein [Alphaproteobacteria bacterium]
MNKYLKQSIFLHIAVFLLFMIDMTNFWHNDLTLGSAPIIVDLSQVRIDEMTNLPAKAEFGPEDRKATVAERKEEVQYTKYTAPEPEPEPAKPEPKAAPEKQPETAPDEQPTEVKQDYLEAPKPEKKPDRKPDPKPTPKKPPVPDSKPKPKPKPQPDNKPKDTKKAKPEEKAALQSSALKSLMQEIDNTKNLDIGETTQSAMIKEGTQVNNMGIEGGSSNGSYLSDLTITETDAIASLLRQNWNLDPGAIGVENMRVEIRVYLNRDGSIKKIEFLDMSRFNSDPSYRSVAESAQRAIIATQQAFKDVFAGKYSGNYDSWSTLRLNFDPLDKGVN